MKSSKISQLLHSLDKVTLLVLLPICLTSPWSHAQTISMEDGVQILGVEVLGVNVVQFIGIYISILVFFAGVIASLGSFHGEIKP